MFRIQYGVDCISILDSASASIVETFDYSEEHDAIKLLDGLNNPVEQSFEFEFLFAPAKWSTIKGQRVFRPVTDFTTRTEKVSAPNEDIALIKLRVLFQKALLRNVKMVNNM
jgi:hypothetical protein